MDTLSITLGTAMDGLAAWLLAKSREADDDDYANVFDD